MNREMKFKVWDKEDKKMSPNWCALNVLQAIDSEKNHDEKIVMQYTGIKDKNEKESAWDDIAKDKHGQVFRITSDYTFLAYLSTIEFEIIGNIHENPELLSK